MSKVWILTAELNEYDQYGQYFITAFKNKPTKDELATYCDHLGRLNDEYKWYTLEEYTLE